MTSWNQLGRHRFVLWGSLCSLTLALTALVFSNYLNYGSESTYLNGLVRILNGSPFISGDKSVPLAFSTYFPTAYSLYVPFLSFLGISEAQGVATASRLLTILFVLLYGLLILRIYRGLIGHKFATPLLTFTALVFLTKEFSALLAIKPDTHGIFYEVMGMGLLLQHLKNNNIKKLLGAGALFGLAVVFKLNLVSFAAAGFFALLFNRKWREVFLLTATGILSLAAGLFFNYLYMGPELLYSLLEATGAGRVATSLIPEIVTRVLYQVVLVYLPFVYMAWVGLSDRKLWNKEQSHVLRWALVLSFVIASLGQLKRGAHINYFHDFEILAILLAAGTLTLPRWSTFLGQALTYISLILVGLSIHLLLVPGQIFSNDLRHYDFPAANQWLDNNLDKPRVYTEYNNAGIHLARRAVLQAGFYNYYEPTATIKAKRLEYIKRIQETGGVNAVMVLRQGCESFKSKNDFSELLSGIDQLAYQKGKICIFTRGNRL